MYAHALVRGLETQEGTFLASIPPEARQLLLAEAIVLEVPGGNVVFSPVDAPNRVGIVLLGWPGPTSRRATGVG